MANLSQKQPVNGTFAASSREPSPSDCHGIDAVQLVPGGVNIGSVDGSYDGVISHEDLAAVFSGEKKIEDISTVRPVTIRPAGAQPGTP